MTQGKIIHIRAYKPEKDSMTKAVPLPDRTGKHYTGQGNEGYYELLSEEEKKKIGYLITPDTMVTITNDTFLDLNDKIDAANWEWLQRHPYIDSEFKVDRQGAMFYVYDRAKEADKTVSRAKRISAIQFKFFNELSETQKRAVAGALGLGDVSGMTLTEVEEYVERTIQNKPGVVEALLQADEKTVNVKVLFQKAVNKNIIERYAAGWYKYGGKDGVSIGNSEEKALEFLSNPANEEVVLAIRSELEQIG